MPRNKYFFFGYFFNEDYVFFPKGDVLIPLKNNPGTDEVDLETNLFIADCIAYDHDNPTMVAPVGYGMAYDSALNHVRTGSLASSEYLKSLRYYEDLASALEIATEIHVGSGIIAFRYEEENYHALNFKHRFETKSEAVSLYAMATRQSDLLMQYLCLYRVIEHVSKNNGADYINSIVPHLLSYEFGKIILDSEKPYISTNLIDTYKARTLELINDRTVENIGKKLYDMRNAIAHGNANFITHRTGLIFDEVIVSLPILKLLARYSIEN